MAPDDAPALYAALAGDEVGRYLGGPDLTSVEDARARIERVLRGPGTAAETWLNYTVRLLDSTVIGRVEATVRDGMVEQSPPYEYELGSWDPGDLVYAYAPARSARNGLAG